MCSIDNLDGVSVYAEDPRVARKEHSCLGCGTTIHKGEAYCRVFCASDGRGYSEKECFACWLTRAQFWKAHNGGPLPFGLEESLRECIDGDHSSEWRPHLAALRRRWRVSKPRLRALRSGWIQGALYRQFRLTRRVIEARAA